MKISTKGKYALEALVYMGSIYDSLPINLRNLSKKISVPERYLKELLYTLCKNQILETKRGSKGGYLFIADIETLTAGKVVNTVEGVITPVPCLNGREFCAIDLYDTCMTRVMWRRVFDTILNVLDHTTISQLVSKYKEMAVDG